MKPVKIAEVFFINIEGGSYFLPRVRKVFRMYFKKPLENLRFLMRKVGVAWLARTPS